MLSLTLKYVSMDTQTPGHVNTDADIVIVLVRGPRAQRPASVLMSQWPVLSPVSSATSQQGCLTVGCECVSTGQGPRMKGVALRACKECLPREEHGFRRKNVPGRAVVWDTEPPPILAPDRPGFKSPLPDFLME